MDRRSWTAGDDEILLSTMEDSNFPPSKANLRLVFPDRSIAAIEHHYQLLRSRELDEDEYSALQASWLRRHLQIFTQYATECNVSVEQYKRIAFRASANLVQYQNDLDTVNCTLVEDNYNTHKRAIWREITRGIDAVSWKQAERAWHAGRGAFGTRF